MRICVCHERVRDKKGGRGQSSLKAIVNSSLAQPKTFFFAVFLSNLYAQITSYRAWTDERETGWHARTRVPKLTPAHIICLKKKNIWWGWNTSHPRLQNFNRKCKFKKWNKTHWSHYLTPCVFQTQRKHPPPVENAERIPTWHPLVPFKHTQNALFKAKSFTGSLSRCAKVSDSKKKSWSVKL